MSRDLLDRADAVAGPTPSYTRRVVAAVEVALAAAAVAADLWLPSLVLVAMAVVSLVVRREGPPTYALVD